MVRQYHTLAIIAVCDARCGEIDPGSGGEPKAAEHESCERHHAHRRDDPPHPPRKELDDVEPARRLLLEDQRGDQVSGNHKEHIHADEAPGHTQSGVEEDDDDDGQGPQPIDVGAV